MQEPKHYGLWVVYLMNFHNNKTGQNAVCQQSEWNEMELARPGYHTLIDPASRLWVRQSGWRGERRATHPFVPSEGVIHFPHSSQHLFLWSKTLRQWPSLHRACSSWAELAQSFEMGLPLLPHLSDCPP